MSLLRPESKRKNYVHIGVYTTPYVHNYLTLYSLAKDTSKSKIVDKLIVNWITQSKLTDNETSLVKEIIQNINNRWKINKSHGICDFDEFKNAVKLELEEKGIKNIYISLILSEIRK